MSKPLSTSHPYKCEVDITFPTARHAKTCMDVLSVDDEIGDRVVKSFELVSIGQAAGSATSVQSNNDDIKDFAVMRVCIQATEAKMLRVSLSTFYDVLNVVLKCFQEFDSA
mmetsp:Transcript_28733/g.52516  ORF Transcript_28733/g.52516 Transcript_28733/m.52516 type:complete len:111 (-) Transcript_28733:399-731(-)